MSPETSESVTPALIRFAPPLSVRVKAPGLRLLVLIGALNETSMVETAEFRGLGETAAIEVTANVPVFVNVNDAGAAIPVAEAVTA